MTPFVNDPDFTLYVGDVLDVLRELPDESVHCCVTSPPYWGLRDYGVDGQLGLEPTPEEFAARMVAVFTEVRRVLRADGTCWLNIGDSYAQYDGQGNVDEPREPGQHGAFRVSSRLSTVADNRGPGRHSLPPGLKRKDLVGIPWRLAFALQADGWYLRSDIIWSKPNPMPESVTDRPTKAHEYVFLLTKSARYFYDADAIREPFMESTMERSYTASKARDAAPKNKLDPMSMQAGGWVAPFEKRRPQDETLGDLPPEAPRGPDGRRQTHVTARDGSAQHRDGDRWPGAGRNKRSVWEIATESYAEAHFATFPQALVEPCIKAGCPEGGTVLDPFMGSGTTALVARRLGRKSVGIELNPAYAALAAKRLSQLSLLAEEAA